MRASSLTEQTTHKMEKKTKYFLSCSHFLESNFIGSILLPLCRFYMLKSHADVFDLFFFSSIFGCFAPYPVLMCVNSVNTNARVVGKSAQSALPSTSYCCNHYPSSVFILWNHCVIRVRLVATPNSGCGVFLANLSNEHRMRSKAFDEKQKIYE